jgi:hypothetical protein
VYFRPMNQAMPSPRPTCRHLLADFFAEHSDDPLEGPPEAWPEWTDQDTWEDGPAIPPDAIIIPHELDGLDRYLIDPELAYRIAYGNCRD